MKRAIKKLECLNIENYYYFEIKSKVVKKLLAKIIIIIKNIDFNLKVKELATFIIIIVTKITFLIIILYCFN